MFYSLLLKPTVRARAKLSFLKSDAEPDPPWRLVSHSVSVKRQPTLFDLLPMLRCNFATAAQDSLSSVFFPILCLPEQRPIRKLNPLHCSSVETGVASIPAVEYQSMNAHCPIPQEVVSLHWRKQNAASGLRAGSSYLIGRTVEVS